MAESFFLNQRRPSGVEIRQGGNLPHREKEGATYAVTFRTADSLPQSIFDRWRREKADLLRRAEMEKRGPSVHEQVRLDWLTSEAVQEYLDAGHGACPMRDSHCAKIVADALQFLRAFAMRWPLGA